ncbi:hypothetical protein KV100_13790 [Mumia sp. zg.B21]|uniref:hypothetical protein n=1 Tax=Mumia sp. zg.B21 TaxID=2855447 RepID=UPI001C6F50DF|nr:hypothetical protein [Mumia sp. zg.B21]MBW9210727.1 hypothetical protein [Mumia sp. zg.B21]
MVVAAALFSPSTAEAAPPVNNSPDFLVTYTANVENLVGSGANPAVCERAYSSLVRYMATRAYAPDIFLVQQVRNTTNLEKLVTTMENHLGVDYTGVIAKPDPRPNGGGGCSSNLAGTASVEMINDLKANQTNAIIYRTARFTMNGSKTTWQSGARVNGGTSCVNAATYDPSQDRTINVAVRLKDSKRTNANVTAASFHWPGSRDAINYQTNPAGVSDRLACATQNINELAAETDDAGIGPSSLQVAGGDANVPDSSGGAMATWYSRGADLGFRDAVAEANGGWSNRTGLATNWTNPSKSGRIDYLFARSSPRTSGGTTVPYEWNGPLTTVQQQYSDHRAVWGYLYY